MAAAALEAPTLHSLGPPAHTRTVSLRRLKAIAERMGPRHPLRLVLLSEPDEVPWEEYASKSEIWFRLLTLKED